ncbi:hypothetical protein QE432_005220 [Agrobacterium sp. SORGH_AS 745]|nr:hypothetical protein [Agrobacterium tumefaciens]MDQ1223592.1 hypothetical protein [Agrobacterium sp. SORGH_AS_0745]
MADLSGDSMGFELNNNATIATWQTTFFRIGASNAACIPRRAYRLVMQGDTSVDGELARLFKADSDKPQVRGVGNDIVHASRTLDTV